MKTISKMIYLLYAFCGLWWMIEGAFIAESDLIFIKGMVVVLSARYFLDHD